MHFSKLLPLACMALVFASACSQSNTSEDMKNNSQQAVIENIMTRASVRQFTSQPVPDDTLELIVKAGMAAPSAMNLQPWQFVVITQREILDTLNVIKPWFNLKTATAAIVVCGDLTLYKDEALREYWVQDCSAATENMLLAAHAYGLGAVWCGVYPGKEIVDQVKNVLALPDSIVPLNVVTMGYPAENPEPKDKFNKEKIHFQRW